MCSIDGRAGVVVGCEHAALVEKFCWAGISTAAVELLAWLMEVRQWLSMVVEPVDGSDGSGPTATVSSLSSVSSL